MNTEDLKTCSKCKEEKPRSEFYKRKVSKDGLVSHCRACRKQYLKQYNKENAEKIKQRIRQYRKENAEKIKQRHNQYYKENVEKINERQRQYYKENVEKISERQKQYSKENAEKIKQQKRKWHKENAEKIKQQKRKYEKENAEKIAQRRRQYRKDNPEKVKRQQKKRIGNQPAAVYGIKNTETGKIYIGQSTAYKRRRSEHKARLSGNKHQNHKLQEDYNKYGLDAFEFEIIKEFPFDTTSDILLEEETRVIAEYVMRGESLYNLSIGFEEFRKFLIEDNNKS